MNIPSIQGNWVDLVILVVVGFYLIDGVRRGFLVSFANLISFVSSLVLALRFYPVAQKILVSNFSIPASFAKALGFFSVAVLSEWILSILVSFLLKRIPPQIWRARWNKLLGVIPAVLDSLILVAFGATLIVVLPTKPEIKRDVTQSKIGGFLVKQTARLESEVGSVFGEAVRDSLTYLTIKPGSSERVTLPKTEKTLSVDEKSEGEMFRLINEERRNLGKEELIWQPEIVPVARAHGVDMWERSYFSHYSPEGKDVGDRLKEAGISFRLAGENLALAPNVTLAQDGLMNSEGHRANILEPKFKKVGIGVIDNGIYGKMFVQVFTD